MPSDFTQHQSDEQQDRAQRLSVQTAMPPGEAIGYEIQRRLGGGAYGEVWWGLDRRTGRQVAIKFYLHHTGLNWLGMTREVEKLAFLAADRYVVQLLDVGWEAEPPYYVMEFVENGSLDALLAERGTLSVERAVELIREIAVGLTHAHGKGVLHCDLKPGNVLLDQDQRPRLADFGQARLTSEQTPALGTLFYMAPEQADLTATPDARWDVYALGALFYCLVTGSPPYRTERTVREIESAGALAERLATYRQAILAAPTPTAHRRLHGMDRGLADIVDRCLARQPSERFPNTQAVLDALESRRQIRERRPLLLLGLVGPLLLLAIVAASYWNSFGRAVAQSETMLREEAFRSNQFAAKYVAKGFQAEIGEYFEIAVREAEAPAFRASFDVVRSLDSLAALNAATTLDLPADLLERFRGDPQRQPLKEYLYHRLQFFNSATAADAPRFSSIFVLDRWGTIVAAAYDDEVTTRSVGKNYCWRTYFHGGAEDLAPFRPLQPPPQIEATHWSAVFKSTTTNHWKVAISTPLFDTTAGQRQSIGVLAITVDLGDFAVFRSDPQTNENYFAVLVDNRGGDRQGTILQHPLFEAQPPDRDYRLDAEQLAALRSGQAMQYRDPLAAAPGGGSYAGQWIAAAQPVQLPTTSLSATATPRDTDLLVLVQVDAITATAPVQQLSRRLAIDALVTLCGVALTIAALWLIVFRVLRPERPSHRRHDRTVVSSTSRGSTIKNPPSSSR